MKWERTATSTNRSNRSSQYQNHNSERNPYNSSWESVIESDHAGPQWTSRHLIIKMKRLLRETVWFPGIDKIVEEMVSQRVPNHVKLQTIIRSQHLSLYKCPLNHKVRGKSYPWISEVPSQMETTYWLWLMISAGNKKLRSWVNIIKGSNFTPWQYLC